MNFSITDEVVKDVHKAASIVANRYPGRFHKEDVAQAIFLDLMERNKAFANAQDRGSAILFSAYKRSGHRYCQAELNRYIHFSDQHMYSSEDLKKILPDYFRSVGDVAKLEDASVGITGLVIDFLDLDCAFSALRKSHKAVLARKYYHEETLSRSEQNLHSKAIKLLTGYVNERKNRQMTYETVTHEGPRIGNRPTGRMNDEFGDSGSGSQSASDSVSGYQKLMEYMY
ncbi:hypothetical protein AB0I72_27375 [Nocardiopsis sp. NPDC049922]|uniref:hypothetical protein n=1 Tax=Nocardiopsis sp. NPDC049922 TaxID=3155157 RepID=UPI0033C4BEE3